MSESLTTKLIGEEQQFQCNYSTAPQAFAKGIRLTCEFAKLTGTVEAADRGTRALSN